MPQMYPDTLEGYIPTKSEAIFFEAIKKQLPNHFHVFFSVRWYTERQGERENSECDFIIINPNFGFLSIEVKGGQGIQRTGENWKLLLGGNNNEGYIGLKRSPFLQAEQSMRFFKKYYEEQYQDRFPGVYGYACAFPNFIVSEDFGPEGPPELIIDFKDMNNLGERINKLFHYWKGNQKVVFFSPEAKNKLVQIINKRIALSAATGALIEEQKRGLEIINRNQDNYLDFIERYNQAYIIGGAGTGKTWMAIKKAIKLANSGDKVLLVCYNNQLMNFIKKMTNEHAEEIDCYTFWKLISRILPQEDFDEISSNNELEGVFEKMSNLELARYDAIIVDEAQDFNEEWALTLRLFLRNEDKSILYAFYDANQNIFDRDFKNAFDIVNPCFILKENIRNTAAIHRWTVENTGIGKDIRSSNIYGVKPELHSFTQARKCKKQLSITLNKLIRKEAVPEDSITILSNRLIEKSFLKEKKEIGEFKLVLNDKKTAENQLFYRTIQGFKGLESDIVIYLHHRKNEALSDNKNQLYVAYTRARFYLYIIEYVYS